MRIKNTSDYNGTDIRGLILACANYYEIDMGKGEAVTFKPKEATHRLAWASRRAWNNSFTLQLCPAQYFIDKLSVVDKLAALSNKGWAAVPNNHFVQLCHIVEWCVRGEDACRVTEVPSWAKGRQLRFKVPKAKVKAVGADYHQEKINKLDGQIATWKENLRKAKQNVARLERGIKAREKDRRYHTKQRDKKAAS